MEEKIKAILNEGIADAMAKYRQKIDTLFAEYNSGTTPEEKDNVVQKIIRLGQSFNALQKAYAEAEQSINYMLTRDIQKYEGWFNAKLNDEPHEYD